MSDVTTAVGSARPGTKVISVVVQDDLLTSMSKARDPIVAVSELIWNGLDADASVVSVELVRNELDGLSAIRVSDNGHGLPRSEGEVAFENLGGSLKRGRETSPGGRKQHGQLGKGRFRAFALGAPVRWETRYARGDAIFEYSILGRCQSRDTFLFSPETTVRKQPGTTVTIENVSRTFRSLDPDLAVASLAQTFALYLRQYPSVRIRYDGRFVDPTNAEEATSEYWLDGIDVGQGQMVGASLVVIEWRMPTDRAILLCDEDGIARGEAEAGIRASGFSFTAYLKSAYLKQLADENALALGELHEGLGALLKAARDQLRAHFRRRAAEAAAKLVETWKADAVYPYTGQPMSSVERVERQVFDILAVNVHAHLPDFDEAAPQMKRLTFTLLRQAIQTNPQSLRVILDQVVKLSKEKQNDFARLLERTSLEAVIAVSRLIADRLEFLAGLQLLVINPAVKRKVKERSQLHRLLAENTWIFGEEFALAADDEDLTTVLRTHFRDRKEFELLSSRTPVLRADGRRAIVDLMLSKRIPLPRDDQRRHLVIELKRPAVKIDEKASSQVKSYAEAVANDPRFRDTRTEWVFWAVSTEVTEAIRAEANQEDRPAGLLSNPKNKPYTVWVKTWGEIIQENEARLTYLKKQLQYRADESSGMAHLQETYEKYIPKLKGDAPSVDR